MGPCICLTKNTTAESNSTREKGLVFLRLSSETETGGALMPIMVVHSSCKVMLEFQNHTLEGQAASISQLTLFDDFMALHWQEAVL